MKLSFPILLFLAAAGATMVADWVAIRIEPPGFLSAQFRFTPKENRGFGILDVPRRHEEDNILKHFNPRIHQLMINGGYFNADFSPTGYCKINGQEIMPHMVKGLSGAVVMNKHGKMSVLLASEESQHYPTVLQSGPFVIDPGGNMGIRSHVGQKKRRTLIGETTSGDLLILITLPIDLYDVAVEVQRHMPEIERLLNLDGGPSTALRQGNTHIVNRAPVRNYIFKRRI